MSLIKQNIARLGELKQVLQAMNNESYTELRALLSGASVGQHIRHIIEFYICLQKGWSVGQVCYDSRQRDGRIENDVVYSEIVLDQILKFLGNCPTDKPLDLKGNYSPDNTTFKLFKSSFYRELAYALDHTVHHLAIVRIALSEHGEDKVLTKDFGVAPSTIRYRRQNIS